MPLTIPSGGAPADISAVDLTQVKRHLKLIVDSADEYTAEDQLLILMIKAATEAYQDRYKVTLITHTYRWDFKEFNGKLELPRPPIQSITEVTYIDENGTEQMVSDSDYTKVTSTSPGFVLFHDDYTFPEVSDEEPYPVRITYVAGYGDKISDVDSGIQLYLMNIIGTMYSQRKTILKSEMSTVGFEDLRSVFTGLIQGKTKAMRFS